MNRGRGSGHARFGSGSRHPGAPGDRHGPLAADQHPGLTVPPGGSRATRRSSNPASSRSSPSARARQPIASDAPAAGTGSLASAGSSARPARCSEDRQVPAEPLVEAPPGDGLARPERPDGLSERVGDILRECARPRPETGASRFRPPAASNSASQRRDLREARIAREQRRRRAASRTATAARAAADRSTSRRSTPGRTR